MAPCNDEAGTEGVREEGDSERGVKGGGGRGVAGEGQGAVCGRGRGVSGLKHGVPLVMNFQIVNAWLFVMLIVLM